MKITNRLKIALKSILNVTLGKVATDKGELVFDGEEIAVGTEVFTHKPSDAEDVAVAEDGEYVLEDGRTLVVAEGKVAEIKEVEEEVVETEEAEETVEVEVAAETNEEVIPVEEPVVEETEEETTTLELEERLSAIVDSINTVVNAVAALEARIADVEGKLAKVEAPAAEPVEVTPEVETKMSRMSYLRK